MISPAAILTNLRNKKVYNKLTEGIHPYSFKTFIVVSPELIKRMGKPFWVVHMLDYIGYQSIGIKGQFDITSMRFEAYSPTTDRRFGLLHISDDLSVRYLIENTVEVTK